MVFILRARASIATKRISNTIIRSVHLSICPGVMTRYHFKTW